MLAQRMGELLEQAQAAEKQLHHSPGGNTNINTNTQAEPPRAQMNKHDQSMLAALQAKKQAANGGVR